MIRFNQLCFSYTEEKQVLKNVNLHINAGEFVAILGANGSGKSTLAQHINALLLPQSGTVSVCEMPTNDPQNTYAIRSLVGMVFQNPDDQIVASLVENDVAFGPKNVGLSPAEQRERVAEALRAVGLEGFERRETTTLSGGQKQRLAIAGALALHPRILVLDEGRLLSDGTPQEVFFDADALRARHLDVSFARQTAQLLQKGGFDDPQNIVSRDALLESVLRSVGREGGGA